MPAQEWARYAVCGPQHSYLFFADSKQTTLVSSAKRICGDCPVRLECLEDALSAETPSTTYGVYGGLDSQERARMLRNKSRKRRKVDHAVTPKRT